MADFATWRDLSLANFPPIDAPPDEPPADWRTDPEKAHDRARALAAALNAQDAFWPLSRFEPIETTLKDLREYNAEQDEINANWAATARRRHAEFDLLLAAADGDLSMTWAEAHRLAHGEDGDEA